jgi:hypothetical protein
MRALLDHDPLSGRSVVFDYNDATDQMTITHVQDVEPFLKRAAEMRASKEYTEHGMEREMLHYAILPEVIQVEMRDKYGVDVNNRDHWPAVFRLINTVYPKFKTTEINHTVRHG